MLKSAVNTKLVICEINLYEVLDIREESDNALLVVDTGLLPIDKLEEILEVHVKRKSDVIYSIHTGENIPGPMVALILAKKRRRALCQIARDVDKTGLEAAMTCYQQFVSFHELEEVSDVEEGFVCMAPYRSFS